MKGDYVVKINNELFSYTEYEDIPKEFDHVIKFVPDEILPPHSEADHEEMDSWNDKFQKLMEIERARSN